MSHLQTLSGVPRWAQPLSCGLAYSQDSPEGSSLLPLSCFVLRAAGGEPLPACQLTSLCPAPSVAVRTKGLALSPASLTSADPCALSPPATSWASALPSPGYPAPLQKASPNPQTPVRPSGHCPFSLAVGIPFEVFKNPLCCEAYCTCRGKWVCSDGK